MNPCPCGYRTSGDDRCTCDPAEVKSYTGRVSGPLLDRIDLHVEVPAVRWRELREGRRGEASAAVRARVEEARARAACRLAGARGVEPPSGAPGTSPPVGSGARPEGGATSTLGPTSGVRGRGEGKGVPAPVPPARLANGAAPPALVNASLTVAEIERFCRLDGAGEAILRRAVERYRLSARAYHRVLRLARTVADLAGSEAVRAVHVAEAVQYRTLDRGEG